MANRTLADKPYISTPMMLSTEPERVRDSPKSLLDGLLIHQQCLPVLLPSFGEPHTGTNSSSGEDGLYL